MWWLNMLKSGYLSTNKKRGIQLNAEPSSPWQVQALFGWREKHLLMKGEFCVLTLVRSQQTYTRKSDSKHCWTTVSAHKEGLPGLSLPALWHHPWQLLPRETQVRQCCLERQQVAGMDGTLPPPLSSTTIICQQSSPLQVAAWKGQHWPSHVMEGGGKHL